MYIFHKIKSVTPLKNYVILVTFVEGFSKTYDIKPLFKKWEVFNELKKNNLFNKVHVEKFGYAVIWNSKIDLHCNEIFERGKVVETPFDGLISFVDATKLWGLNESTLRKAVQYKKLIEGVDVLKFGKQWVITVQALIREYGPRPNKEF